MKPLLNDTLSDLRGGRQTWRVFALVLFPAFFAGLAAGIAQHLG